MTERIVVPAPTPPDGPESPMSINVICSCGRRFQVREELAGKQRKCSCGAVILVPGVPQPPASGQSGTVAAKQETAKLPKRDQEMRAALEPHLEQGERLKSWAHGSSRRVVWFAVIIIGSVVLGLILATLVTWSLLGPRFGIIPSIVFSVVLCVLNMAIVYGPMKLVLRDYVVGLTDRRLLILRVKSPVYSFKKINFGDWVSCSSYQLQSLPVLRMSNGTTWTKILIRHPTQAILVRFSLSDGIPNYQRALKIASMLADAKKVPTPR